MSTNAHRERLMQVLLGPHVSEKATGLAEAGQIVFKVRGDATKARVELGWQPTVSFKELVEMMISAEVRRAQLPPPGGVA